MNFVFNILRKTTPKNDSAVVIQTPANDNAVNFFSNNKPERFFGRTKTWFSKGQ